MMEISIHSPLAGRDHEDTQGADALLEISIHSPLAGRDIHGVGHRVIVKIFQSTRPSRGETSANSGFDGLSFRLFQSTRPSRGETRRKDGRPPATAFQSTRPSRGETPTRIAEIAFINISIHSPLAGRDPIPAHCSAGHGFQSTRPSRGETRRWSAQAEAGFYFNPLAPRGARPYTAQDGSARASLISIHSPLAGRDCNAPTNNHAAVVISIHSPLAGRDQTGADHEAASLLFQSTRPSRGETLMVPLHPLDALFQSTRPSRGETIW